MHHPSAPGLFRRLAFLLLFLLPSVLRADENVRYAPPSAWVDEAVTSDTVTTPAAAPASGLAYLLCDYQVHLGTEETFTRIASRVLTEYGRGNSGELRFGFEPTYQTLTLHHVRIHRDGVVLDRLDPAKVKVLHRETNAEAGLYNGRRSALVIVEDLRVGDVLDYSFTVRGRNPVFAGRFSDSWSLQGPSPTARHRVRLLLPENRALQWRILAGKAVAPVVTPTNGLTEWTWDQRDTPGLDYENGAPAWHLQYPVLQVSEHADWEAVAAWGRALYPLDSPLPPELETFAASLGTRPPAERAVAALQRVQDEIRYLSLSLGESSHRPHLPAAVYAQRFGDCKDKAFLLTVLLRRLGLDAAPALVDSDSGEALDRWLPSSQLFDHVIVHLRLDGADYWLDPTRSYQAGPLAERNVTTFGWALPLRVETTRLTRVMPTPASTRRIDIVETFTSAGTNRPVALAVRRVFSGPAADAIRAYLADNTPERVGKDRLNRYAQIFPSIQTGKPPRWDDNRATNRVTIEETFTIPEFWKHQVDQHEFVGDVYPLILHEMIERPSTPRRVTPLACNHPFAIHNRIILDLHESTKGSPLDWTEKTEAYIFSKRTSNAQRRFTIDYDYCSTANQVPAAKCPEYARQIGSIRDRIGHTFTFGDGTSARTTPPAPKPPPRPDFALNWPIALLLLLVLPIAGYISWRLARPAPPCPPPLPLAPGEPDLARIGGWLILVAISLVLGTFISLRQLPATLGPVLNLHVWAPLTTPGPAPYHALYAPALLGEAAYNTLRGLAVLLAGLLFCLRRRYFPQVMITILAATPIALIADTIAVHYLPGSTEAGTIKNAVAAGQTLVASAIWIPYFLVSRRVKATFVR